MNTLNITRLQNSGHWQIKYATTNFSYFTYCKKIIKFKYLVPQSVRTFIYVSFDTEDNKCSDKSLFLIAGRSSKQAGWLRVVKYSHTH